MVFKHFGPTLVILKAISRVFDQMVVVARHFRFINYILV